MLLTKGLEDCESVDANHVDAENRGRLIHVQAGIRINSESYCPIWIFFLPFQGKARGMVPIADHQFQDQGCLWIEFWRSIVRSA